MDDKGKQVACPSFKPQANTGRWPSKPWRPPEDNWIKVNVDGAYLEQTGRAGVRYGKVLLSAWMVVHGARSAEEVEAQACREGLMLAAEWTPKPTILESDCSTVIRYLENPKSQRTAYGFIIQEAVEASRKLPKVVFQHIGRESNVLAHELSQLAVRLNHSAVWRDRVPVCVERHVAHDVNARVIE
jgi:ribonuclease HI